MTLDSGRPTKYKPEYCQEVDEYLETTGRGNQELPMVEGFADYLDVVTKTLYNWADKHSEFLHALEKIKAKQLLQLVNDGIYGGKEVNAAIVKLMLQNNHGMKERKDYTSGDKPWPILGHVPSGNSDQEDTGASEED